MSKWGRQKHLLADLWGCPRQLLADGSNIQRAMEEAARRAGATVVDTTFHTFPGGGVTGVVAVKESHLTIHTWPERSYAAVDIFLCSTGKPSKALDYLVSQLRPSRTAVHEHARGKPSDARSNSSQSGGTRQTHALGILYGLTIIVAMCSIVYELLLAQTLSALLGNTVLRYSVTVGCYLGALGLGALLCSRGSGDSPRRLARIEIALSALGGLSVPLFYFLDSIQRYVYLNVEAGSAWETMVPCLFLVFTHAVIIGIGLLSGFEVPLLLAIGEQIESGSTNKVLGVDYFGALVGSLLFPLVLLRSLGLLATCFVVALVNVLAAMILVLWQRPARAPVLGLACGAVGACLLGGLVWSGPLEQRFLKQFYYVYDAEDLAGLMTFGTDKPEVARVRSPYQTIDLIRNPWATQWVYDYIIADTNENGSRYPRDLWLYLDREFQFLSGMEEIYHEWFVHAPVQANSLPPRDVLVLGGGDGLAIREALKYDTVERLVHVDIDAEMLRLAREHPWLVAMNGGAHRDSRVTEVQADAFRWLRGTADRFDAVYIDMPYARNYNLSLVYSREFYGLVRQHLKPWGFVAIDTPGGWCDQDDSLWAIYYNTLRAAGFQTVLPMLSRIDTQEPQIADGIDRAAADFVITAQTESGRTVEVGEERERLYLQRILEGELEGNMQEFTLAFPVERTINVQWVNFGVPMRAFRPYFLPLAFQHTCPTALNSRHINSIARPTLPPLELLSVKIP